MKKNEAFEILKNSGIGQNTIEINRIFQMVLTCEINIYTEHNGKKEVMMNYIR